MMLGIRALPWATGIRDVVVLAFGDERKPGGRGEDTAPRISRCQIAKG